MNKKVYISLLMTVNKQMKDTDIENYANKY